MGIERRTICDLCGGVKGVVQFWFAFRAKSIKEDAIGAEDKSARVVDLCEHCHKRATKFFDRGLAAPGEKVES